ncbi:MAG: hypothetical protein WBA38_05625 [Gordonia sp. (in: high G+C Gram-positive bacteria)]
MTANQLSSRSQQGRIHIWRLLAMVAVLIGIMTVLLLIAASAV